MKSQRTVKRGAARPVRTETVRVRLYPAEIIQLRRMAKRLDLSDSAFVRRMLEVHAKIEAEVLREKAERDALEQRRLIEASRRDEAVDVARATRDLTAPAISDRRVA